MVTSPRKWGLWETESLSLAPYLLSPQPADVLAALRRICGSGGTLMIATNYTGDRLNFGLAAEQAKAVGYKVDMVMVGEDCITQHCGSYWTVWDNTGT